MSTWLRGARRTSTVLARLPEAIVALDRTATILWASAGAELFGHRSRDLVGRNGLDLIDPRDVETAAAAMLRTMDAEGPKQPWPLRIIGRDGRSRWVEMAPTNLLDDPDVEAVLLSIRPLDGRDAVDAEWRSIEELFRRAFDDAPIGMALMDVDRRLMRVNSAFCDLLHRSQLELLGTDMATWTHPVDLAIEEPMIDAVLAGELRSYVLDKRCLRADGSSAWVSVGVSFARTDGDGPERFVVHVQDITERKASEASLAHRATHDPLTDLPNRALLEDRLTIALARLDRVTTDVVVLFCDLVGFKTVNDRLGHDAGDQVLVTVAERMRHTVRSGDTVARLGGDELVVVCEDVASDAEMRDVADRLAHAIGLPIAVAGDEVVLGLTIGRAVAVAGESARDLVARADADMYAVRAAAPAEHNGAGD